ncbi:villin-like 1 [Striga asiatica]|uniref:Villin-like 1 n=1 Tax=Striga asiatica TaxID=4170 RepID=A0A5A7NZH0_STRAF|nr:villin-like 1 [Striga asiatica]
MTDHCTKVRRSLMRSLRGRRMKLELLLSKSLNSMRFLAVKLCSGVASGFKKPEEDMRLYMLKQFHEGKCKVGFVDDGALSKSILGNKNCYLFDCGFEVFVWVDRVTQVKERKSVICATEDFVARQGVLEIAISLISSHSYASLRQF